MSEGYIIVQTLSSTASFPIPNAAVTFTRGRDKNKELLAFRVTDSSGKTSIVALQTPPMADSQAPGGGEGVFALCDIEINHPDFYTLLVRGVQVFANETSIQNCELRPIDIDRDPKERVEDIDITAQNL